MEEVFTLNLGRLIFVLIVFLTFSFLALKTKKYFFYSTLFLFSLIPFNITLQQPNFDVYIHGISSNYVIPTIHLLDIFVFFILLSSLKERFFLQLKRKEKIFFLLFFIFLTIKVFLDYNLLSTILIYRLFSYALASFLILKFFDFQKNIGLLSKILFFSILIQLLIGILQFKLGHSLGLIALGESQVAKGMFGSSFIDLNGTLFLRSYGTFPHPNVLAGFLLLSVFFSVSFLKERIIFFTAILSTILIFLTFSRIAIVLVFFLWVLFFFLKYFSKQKLFSFFPLFSTRFLNLFSEKDSSFSDRMELMNTSIEILEKNPLFGIGVGKFIYGIELFPVYTSGGFLLLQPVHNVFLLILSEYGFVFGLPLVVLILFFLFKNFFKTNLFLKFFIFSLFLFLIFDHFFFTLPQGLVLFVLLLNILNKKDIM